MGKCVLLYWNHLINSFVCLPVTLALTVTLFVRTISAEPLNLLQPNLPVQGDPPKMPPTKMLITSSSTYVQRFTSYLVHINFSLCRIIRQSFQSVCQMVSLLCSLLNVFQMTPLALQAHCTNTKERVAPLLRLLHTFPGIKCTRSSYLYAAQFPNRQCRMQQQRLVN